MTTVRAYLVLAAIGLASVGCSGGSTSGTTASGLSGIAVPQEISALPTSQAASARIAPRVATSQQALSASSDYEQARTFKYVNEQSLNQFDILNTIFKAVAQTHYADAENVGAGPYGAMVTWLEDKGDSQVKQIKSWVVNSSMEVENGQNVNHVRIWMRNMMDGGGPQGMTPPEVIKADLRIREAPVQRADGSYSDYGVWTLNVGFNDSGNAYFVASAGRAADGASVVMLHQKFPGEEVSGILHKSDTQGFGKVSYPDWNSCHEPQCTPPSVIVAYVYDAAHVALKKGDAPVVFKDRTNAIDLANRYGLFDAVTGQDVSKTHAFGFPIQYTDANGSHYGYYGAWQGRHQIWTNGQSSIPEGTTVTRGDLRPGQTAQSFTVSKPFTGTLVKRTLVAADILDIKDLVVETWVNQSMTLSWDGSQWSTCIDPGWGQFGPTCGSSVPFTNFAVLAYDPNDTRRNVFINAPPNGPGQPQLLAYQFAGPSGPGFYDAVSSPNSPPSPTSTLHVFSPGDRIWVNISGAIYISYNGSDWIQKKLLSFDQSTYTPTFDPGGDTPYSLDTNREYYINNPGANYIVKYDGSAYDVRIELQSVANPANVATFLQGVSYFKPQWGGADSSTYEFVTDSADSNFLKLVFRTVGQADSSKASVGDVVTNGQWGLLAYGSNDASTGVQFNWDYPQSGQNWGTQQFLLAGSSYHLLDDPIRLAPITLVNHHGDSKTYSLQFDGSWVSGLPDIFRDLQQNDFNFTAELADKVVLIPAGTEVTDANDSSKHYLFKPLQLSQYLALIADPGNLDLSAATSLDLSAVPGYVPSGMGDIPSVPVKYSEGVLVQ